MRSDFEQRSDRDCALRWLDQRLEWERILAALRDAAAGGRADPAPAQQEPAAA
jgi:hypothetical protein